MSQAIGRDGARPGGAISLDQLIALNDEIAALVRAGVPLGRGMLGLRGDLRGRLGALVGSLAGRLERGEDLSAALAAEGDRLPRVYRAVVEAGLRSGRLAVALEGLARFARTFAELRRAVGQALLYPLMVVVLAYALFLGFVWQIAPRFREAFGSFGFAVRGPMALLSRLGETIEYWGPIFPAVLVVLGLWWAWSGRAVSLQGGWAGGPLAWLPWMRRMLANTRWAGFAELLALLVEHRVPLPEAVVLAAEASGDRRLRRAAVEIAESARRGEPLRSAPRGLVPPLLGWLMAGGGAPQGDLPEALRHAAHIYRRRALHEADLIRVLLPTLLMFAIGATATLLYTLSLFVPLADLLGNLSLD